MIGDRDKNKTEVGERWKALEPFTDHACLTPHIFTRFRGSGTKQPHWETMEWRILPLSRWSINLVTNRELWSCAMSERTKSNFSKFTTSYHNCWNCRDNAEHHSPQEMPMMQNEMMVCRAYCHRSFCIVSRHELGLKRVLSAANQNSCATWSDDVTLQTSHTSTPVIWFFFSPTKTSLSTDS